MIPMSPLMKLELPTKSQLQAGCLLTIFLTSLSSCFFPSEVNQTFIIFLMTHHNRGTSRVMPSHLEGFTSKSNKYHEDCFTNRILSTQTWNSHKSHKPHKEVMGRAHKDLEMSVFHGWHQHSPKVGGRKLLYLSPKN
jgi:hypothetical protein